MSFWGPGEVMWAGKPEGLMLLPLPACGRRANVYPAPFPSPGVVAAPSLAERFSGLCGSS